MMCFFGNAGAQDKWIMNGWIAEREPHTTLNAINRGTEIKYFQNISTRINSN